MFKKNKLIKMGLPTALVLIATVGVLTIVAMSPNGGITTSAHAFMIADPSGKHGGNVSSGGMGAGIECDCLGVA